MSLFPAYRGIKIKPYMVNLRYYIFSFFFLLFSPALVFYGYLNFEKIKGLDIPSIVILVNKGCRYFLDCCFSSYADFDSWCKCLFDLVITRKSIPLSKDRKTC